MENNKAPSIKIKIEPEGSIKGSVINSNNKTIADITSKGKKFNMIERKVNNEGEISEIIHSAWGNNFYHEDVKYKKLRKYQVVAGNKKIDENKKLKEKQLRKAEIKKILLKYKNL